MLFVGCQLYIIFIALVYDTREECRQGGRIVEEASENGRGSEGAIVQVNVIFCVI